MKQKLVTLTLIAILATATFIALYEVPTAKADSITDAISLGLDWLDRMAYAEINSTHAVALESPSLSFRMKRSDGYWTIFGKKTDLNLPPSATMIRGGCLDPQATTDDLNLITGEVDNQRMKYLWDIDGDSEYDDVTLYVEYATMNDTYTRVAGKITQYSDTGVSLQLYLEFDEVISSVSLNQQFSIDKEGGWSGRRYTIRPTTKGLADLYYWLGTTEYSWLGNQTYQETRGVNYTDRALKLYRTWYGSGYILDRFDGQYGATVNTRPWAGQYGIPDYPANPDLIVEPRYLVSEDLDAYIDNDNKTAGWYDYDTLPDGATIINQGNVARFATVSRSIMPDDTDWNNCPFLCSDTEFCYAYRSRTGFNYARNQYIANGLEFDLLNYNDLLYVIPGADLVLGIGTDAKSIRACHDMYKYGANVPYGLSTLRQEFIDSAEWDGNGIARDSWHGTPIGWAYPAYGTHNTATYGNALVQYYKLTSDENYGAKADDVIGVLLMLQNKLGQEVFSRSKSQSYYRAEFVGSFLPGYAVAYSFGQQDIYSASWVDTIYGTLQFLGIFEQDPQSTSYPCMGNAECTIPSVWTLIQYKTTGRTPNSPPEDDYVLSFQDNVIAYTDHGGSLGGDGNTEIVSSNLTSTYIGGDTGNLYKHTGKLDKIRMKAYGYQGWSQIEYEWNFTLSDAVSNWRAKVYFTIPEYMAITGGTGNSLTVTVSLYNSSGGLITQDSKLAIDGLQGTTGLGGAVGKMFFYNNMATLSSLSAGNYTVKLKFYAHAGPNAYLALGYQVNSYWDLNDYYYDHDDMPKGLPMGLEYFGYDYGNSAFIQNITLSPTDDSWVFSYYKNNNYGTNPSAEIGYNTGSRTSFINFNLSQLQSMVQSGYVVTNASLILQGWLSKAPTTDIQINAYHVTQNWSEATITYNNKPSYNSTIIGSVVIPGQPRYGITATIDLTQPLSAVLASQSPFYGYRLYGSNSTQIFIWSTKEYSNPAERPQLIVTLSY